ncbi:MAG: NAD(P)/FAD-dependent oxidoreductase [Candidatus Obscuribacter sp.]|nr:NAD(P)/FAD-dependent oxidoreductase [Candidatus Obscuribacter sp.]MBL8081661.1 NAD(P)/FAD-dependent oxidoreductase [Candidatus Obscuribacter sp.]
MKEALSKNCYPVVIAGAGPAGVSVALGLLEARIEVLLIDAAPDMGGQLPSIPSPITNFAGGYKVTGRTAGKDMKEALLAAAERAGEDGVSLTYLPNYQVAKFDARTNELQLKSTVQAKDLTVCGERVVFCTGYRERRLQLPGQAECEPAVYYHGKGEDGDTAVVIGGGDSALLKLLAVAPQMKNVILIHRNKHLKARPDVIAKVSNLPNLEVFLGSQVVALARNAQTGKITVDIETMDGGGRQTRQADWLAVKVGYLPNTEFLADSLLLEKGHVVVDSALHAFDKEERMLPTVFAGGDIVNGSFPRIATACGHGMSIAAEIIKATFENGSLPDGK